eukprot:2621991-Rhodomonas_salina.1
MSDVTDPNSACLTGSCLCVLRRHVPPHARVPRAGDGRDQDPKQQRLQHGTRPWTLDPGP